ncbi:tetratricopeptide repeat protein [Egbenema bharatensis]|uniref:tetratricopeptide repeat protein n=1 Tax=Egbenema bharatensis TaxID=3463334 RepID=UPI003A8BBACC
MGQLFTRQFKGHMVKKYPRWISIVSGVGIAAGITAGTIGVTLSQVQAQVRPAIVSEGYTLLDRGWVNDAIGVFRQAVQQYPQSVEAQLGLAIAYQRNGQDADAWNRYQQVLSLDPQNRPALAAIGELGGYRTEWQRSGIAALTTLLELDPSNLTARSQRALLYGYQGQFTEAIADYEIVLAAEPTPDRLLGAAEIYTYSGNYSQGLEWFEAYLRTNATIPNNQISAYALALQETGRADRAVQVLSSRLASLPTLDETAIQIRTTLAIAYQRTGQLEAALSTLEPLEGNANARLPLARALSTIGRLEDDWEIYEVAVSLYRQILEQTTNPSPGLQTEIADVLSEFPMTQPQALMLYQALLSEQPENQSLQIKQLVVANQIGQLPRIELYEQLAAILQTLPTSPTETRLLAQALVRVDPPAPALLPIYQSLLQANTEVPFLHFRLAQIYLQQGNFANARQALSQYSATPIGSQDWAPELLLAEIDRREGNFNASVQRYESIIAANPRPKIVSDALRGLAGIRLAQGQLNDALILYNQLLDNNPDDLVSQIGKASIAYQTQQISRAEAESVLDRWQRSEPVTEPPPEVFNLAGVLPPAIDRQPLYLALLAQEPDNLAINRRLVQVLVARDPDEARQRVNELVIRDPNNLNVYYVQGEFAQAIGDLELAGQSYEIILAQQPNNPDALSALGGVRFQQRRYGEATNLFTEVLSLKPGDLETRRVLAELRAAQDQPIEALEQLREIQTLQAEAGITDPRVEARIRQLQGDLLRRRGFQPEWERF